MSVAILPGFQNPFSGLRLGRLRQVPQNHVVVPIVAIEVEENVTCYYALKDQSVLGKLRAHYAAGRPDEVCSRALESDLCPALALVAGSELLYVGGVQRSMSRGCLHHYVVAKVEPREGFPPTWLYLQAYGTPLTDSKGVPSAEMIKAAGLPQEVALAINPKSKIARKKRVPLLVAYAGVS